ncbi:MAG: hypothetical protein J2P25_01230 [Nocardiopsaceae bacterium]|nr:hypothetical protein [Nocardiopsaceae bacterium]
MSLIRLLPARFHAVADYAVAAALIGVPLFVIKGSMLAVGVGVVVGVIVAVVSALTRYPLGLVKVLPFTVHSAGDYLAVALLVAAPFSLRFTRTDPHLTVFYIAAGLAVLVVSVITDYQYSPGPAPAQALPIRQDAPANPAAAVQPSPASQGSLARELDTAYQAAARQATAQQATAQQAAAKLVAAQQGAVEQIAAQKAAAKQAAAYQAAAEEAAAEQVAAEQAARTATEQAAAYQAWAEYAATARQAAAEHVTAEQVTEGN